VILEARVGGRSLRVEVHEKDARYAVSLDGRILDVDAVGGREGALHLLIDGEGHEAILGSRGNVHSIRLREGTFLVEIVDPESGPEGTRPSTGPTSVTAPMPGRLVRVLVSSAGEGVRAGQGLVVMEAMKMENELRAPRDGRILEIHAREGQAVETGELLVVLE
jgi:biotin carboxyl carrier protein